MEDNTWILDQEIRSAHNAISVKQILADKHISALEHPPYSPDLVPYDFNLFPKIIFGVHLKTASTYIV